MANIFEGELKMTDDWGRVINSEFPEGAPASGEAVQKFIKNSINAKPGFIFGMNHPSENKTIILGFRDKDIYEDWVASGSDINSELIITKTEFDKAEPQPYNTVLLENKESSNIIISTDNTVVIDIKFSSIHYEPSGDGMIASDTNEDGELVVQKREGNNWENLYSKDISSKNIESIDLTEYLANGSQEIRMQVTGKTTGLTSSWITYDVTKTNLGLKFATSWENAQTTNYMSLGYYMTGAVNKYLNIKITGAGGVTPRELEYYIGSKVYAEDSGVPYSFNITDNNIDSYKVTNHGIHNIESWVTVKIDGKIVAESDHIHSQILMATDKNNTQPYIILNNLNTELTNWSQQDLFSYALYHPSSNSMPVSIILSNYNTGDEYLKFEEEVQTKKVYTYTNIIEVEGNNELLYAKLDIKSEGESLIDPIAITINNKGGYSPTAGADFIFNPKSRSNNVEDPAHIFNAIDNSEIPSKWTGFTFSRDGWVEDENKNRCLRVLGGQTIEIDYNPFMNWGTDNSCTIEMSVATRNVVDENTPVLRMCRYKNDGVNFEGWEMRPLDATFMTANKSERLKQDIWVQEDSQTHIAINILHNMYSINENNTSKPVNLVRIFINGIINREFAYEEDTLSDNESTDPSKLRKIIIGDINANADIDIYSIRVYKKKLSSSDILQDFVSNLSTASQKEAIKKANDILGENGLINYEKTSQKYNTLLWKYSPNVDNSQTRLATYGDADDAKQKGDLVIRLFNEDGTLDEGRSGTINNMTVKGQGTSSMTYWKWNQRWEFKEYEEEDKQLGYEDSVFTPLNWDGESDRKAAWQPAPGQPFAKRLDGKINWASPMQSHKLGSVGMYNDLWKIVIGNNEITSIGASEEGKKFTGTPNGYSSCRVAVIQKPFLVFVQENADAIPTFYGLYTMGPSKGDKPTFGYNKNDFPNFVMMEGCDNGAPLVNCKVPWNNEDVKIPSFEDDRETVGEVYNYDGKGQWEISMGSTKYNKVDFETGNEINPVLLKFKEMNNFCYLLNPDITYWEGTYDELRTTEKGLDTSKFYWTTSNADGNAAYNLYRYDSLLKAWVHAGVNHTSADNYEVLNLVEQTGYNPTSGNYASWNKGFIDKRVAIFKEGIKEYVDERDMRYSMQFLKLIAASDNWAKNTYIYNAGITDEDGKVVSKFRFFQDDLDTIFSLNNTGYKVKPYYVEEHDVDESGSNYWNADKNAFYCLAELAWPTEMRDMMKEILSAAASLGGGTVMGCFEKYYQAVTDYFPALSYNEIARLLYEDAYKNKLLGNYGSQVDPLAQCVGDQRDGERQWQRRRSIYLSSYAQYGEFDAKDGSGNTGAISFRSALVGGSQAKYKFELIPSMWLYPSMGVGSSYQMPKNSESADIPPRMRVGEPVSFEFTTDGNTNIFLRGADYYSNIGDLGKVSTANTDGFTLSGKRLTSFHVTDSDKTDYNKIVFRPLDITIQGQMPAIKDFIINGSVYDNTSIVKGGLNLSNLWKLEIADLRASSITNIILPENSNIKSLYLPLTLETLTLHNQSKLNDLIAPINSLSSVSILDCPQINVKQFIEDLFNSNKSLESLEINNINWNEVSIELLQYLTNIHNCKLYGTIELDKNEILDFSLKYKLMNKFGDIDNEDNDLYIKYTLNEFNRYTVTIIGDSYVYKLGSSIYELSTIDGSNLGNNISKIEWSITDNKYATIDDYGVLTINDEPDPNSSEDATISCKITLNDNQVVTITKEIYFYEKEVEVGDYIYYDGYISSPEDWNRNKTVIGVCYYVNGNDRRMMALDLASQNPVMWGLSKNYFSTLNYDANYINAFYGEGNFFNYESYTNTERANIGFGVVEDGLGAKRKYSADKIATKGRLTEAYKPQGIEAGLPQIPTGTSLPCGQCNTLNIIEHRNEMVIKQGLGGKIPGTDAGGSYIKNELEDLTSIIDNAKQGGNIQTESAMYPAASFCYLYEPQVKNNEELDDRFKKYNWYLPSISELMYMWICSGPDMSLCLNKCSALKDAGLWKEATSWGYGQGPNYWSSNNISYGNTPVVQFRTNNMRVVHRDMTSGKGSMDGSSNTITRYYIRACAKF